MLMLALVWESSHLSWFRLCCDIQSNLFLIISVPNCLMIVALCKSSSILQGFSILTTVQCIALSARDCPSGGPWCRAAQEKKPTIHKRHRASKNIDCFPLKSPHSVLPPSSYSFSTIHVARHSYLGC
jgi:hypothetical protein